MNRDVNLAVLQPQLWLYGIELKSTCAMLRKQWSHIINYFTVKKRKNHSITFMTDSNEGNNSAYDFLQVPKQSMRGLLWWKPCYWLDPLVLERKCWSMPSAQKRELTSSTYLLPTSLGSIQARVVCEWCFTWFSRYRVPCTFQSWFSSSPPLWHKQGIEL